MHWRGVLQKLTKVQRKNLQFARRRKLVPAPDMLFIFHPLFLFKGDKIFSNTSFYRLRLHRIVLIFILKAGESFSRQFDRFDLGLGLLFFKTMS